MKLTEKYSEKLKENNSADYDEYLARSGIAAKSNYLDAISEANAALAMKSTDRGVRAENLNKTGLSGSGYEEYIKAQNSAEYQGAYSIASREYAVSDSKNRGGYEKYLSDYDKLQSKISGELIKSFGETLNFSIESAYKTAIDMGLNEDNALFAAAKAVSTAKNNAINAAIEFAKLNGLTPYRAKDYAESLGLDKKSAERVYNALTTLSDEEKQFFSSMSPGEYYEYIKERASK